MNPGALLAGCQIVAAGLFVLWTVLDFVSIFLGDVIPGLLLAEILITSVTGVWVVVVQLLACLRLFPLRNKSTKYVKNIDLAILFSIACVLLTTALKLAVFLVIGNYYNYSPPFGVLMVIDHSTLPFAYVWGYVQAYNCAAIFSLLCVFLYGRALAAYYFPKSSMD